MAVWNTILTVIKSLPDITANLFEAIRVAVFPPWQTGQLKHHAAVNSVAGAISALVFYFTREFTAHPLAGVAPAVVGIIIGVVFQVVVGIAISILDPTSKGTGLANRWSTFLIISFFYELVLLAIGIGAIPLIVHAEHNPLDWLTGLLFDQYHLAGAVVSLAAALVATALLYWRAKVLFRNLRVYSPRLTLVYFLLCAAANFVILYLLVFVIT